MTPPLLCEGLAEVGLELGGVGSVGACRGVEISDECEMDVKVVEENEDDVGGCKEDVEIPD